MGVSATVLATHSDFRDMVEFLLDKGADPSAAGAGFSALHEAIMRRDEKIVAALLDHGADANAPLKTWTPTRRASQDYNFEPVLVGATPYWLAARFVQPNVMRMLVQHGADPKFVHRPDYVAEANYGQAKKVEVATALMAATGIINVKAWAEPSRPQREALTLETVKLTVEQGADLNVANTDGRTALDGAQALKYKSVVDFLVEKGAKPGTGNPPGRGRGARITADGTTPTSG